MINPFLSQKVLEKSRNVFITAFGKSLKDISMSFIRQGTNFIQTGMQLLGDHRNILALNLGENFALKNLEEILEGIDDIARRKEDLIQH